eukprot:g2059.t1
MDYDDQNLIDEACSKRCGLYAKRKIIFCNSEFMKPQKTNAVKEFLSINELFGLGTGKKQAHRGHIDNISAHEKWFGFKIDPQQSISNDVLDDTAEAEQDMIDELDSFEFNLSSFILDNGIKTSTEIIYIDDDNDICCNNIWPLDPIENRYESKVLKNNYDYNPCSPGIPSMWTFSPMEKLHHLLL